MRNVLYVGNLPVDTNAGALRAYFTEYGDVSDVRIVADARNVAARRFALVTMASPRAATRAVSLSNGAFLDGRELRVSILEGQVLPGTRIDAPAPPDRPLPAPAPAPRDAPMSRGREAERAERPAGARRREEASKEKPAVRITQQFRERHNMTYELDCSGTVLVVRVFFPADEPGAEWRIDATAAGANGHDVASASAASREQALQRVAQHWQRADAPTERAQLDWAAVAQAMAAVRAI
jgi:RNA recognition motif-containing protein